MPIVAIDPTGYFGFELGPSDLWIQQQDGSTGSISLYSVPKSGGPLGSPAYTTAPGLLIEGVYIDGSTIYWAERSQTNSYANTVATIYSSPVATALSPTLLTTFIAEGATSVLASNGNVYFDIETLVPHPTPQAAPSAPPNASGDDAGSSESDGGSSGDAALSGSEAGLSPPSSRPVSIPSAATEPRR